MIFLLVLIILALLIVIGMQYISFSKLKSESRKINNLNIELQQKGLEIEGQIEDIKEEIDLVSELYSSSDKLIHLEDDDDVYNQIFININKLFSPAKLIIYALDDEKNIFVKKYAEDPSTRYPDYIDAREMKVDEYFNSKGVSMIVRNTKDRPLFYIKMQTKLVKNNGNYIESIYTNTDFNIFNLFVTQAAMVLDKIKDYKKMRRMALTDNLTGLYNRHYAHMRIKQEAKRASREGYPISVIFADIDKFKSVNDTFGHDIGDLALKHVANIINDVSREYDVAIRWGGEEFVLFLPNTTTEGALALAERLRVFIENSDFQYCKLTLSLGIATYPIDNMNVEKVIGFADEALYYSKQSGRNRTTLYRDVKHLIGND